VLNIDILRTKFCLYLDTYHSFVLPFKFFGLILILIIFL